MALTIDRAKDMKIDNIKPLSIIKLDEEFALSPAIIKMAIEQMGKNIGVAKQVIAEAQLGTTEIKDKLITMLGKTMEQNLRLDWPALVKEAVKRRREQRLTQEKLAVFAGVSKPTLNNFEQGKTNITLDKALKILTSLGLA